MSKKWLSRLHEGVRKERRKEFSGKFYLKHDAVRLTGAKQSPQFPGSGHLEAVFVLLTLKPTFPSRVRTPYLY